jgi:Ca2+-binding RTX toxin-like protein
MAWNNGKWMNGTNGDNVLDLRWQNPFDVRDNADGLDGDDTIYGNIADNTLRGGDGFDLIYGGGGKDTLRGSTGEDVMFGEDGDDSLAGNEDGDYLSGGGGNDTLSGGDGTDDVFGGDGNDTLSGGANNDNMMGAEGHDTLSGGSGNDTIYGDWIDTGSGSDDLFGGDGDDTVVGNGGSDFMRGDSGNDSLDGGSGNDTLHGDSGNDTLRGGEGSDEIYSLLGVDQVFGGADGDEVFLWNVERLFGGTEVNGGAGADTLHIEHSDVEEPLVFDGLPDSVTSFERIYIEGTGTEELNLSFRDVIRVSSTDHLVIDGTDRDTVRLENNVAGDALSGGIWVSAGTQLTADPSESFARFEYLVNGTVEASMSIDTDINVFLI